jgi:purine nucleosidase
VEAITTVAGNVGLEATTANAATILDALGIPAEATPIFPGSAGPMIGRHLDAAFVHGADGLGNSHFPRSSRRVEPEHAALAQIRLASAFPGDLTFVTIGPLTNLALATVLDPILPNKVKRLVVMGGAIRGTGNMPRPSTESTCIPTRRRRRSSFSIGLGSDLSGNHDGIHAQPRPGRRPDEYRHREGTLFSGASPSRRSRLVQEKLGLAGLFAPDPLAMAVALEPEIVTRSELRPVTVELAGATTRGQTTVDWFGLSGRRPIWCWK